MNNICAKVWERARRQSGIGVVMHATSKATNAYTLWQRLSRGERSDALALLRLWLRQRH